MEQSKIIDMLETYHVPPSSTPWWVVPTSINTNFRRKNRRGSFIAFHDTEPPPPPVLHREAKSGVRSGLQRGESSVFVITNPPSSSIPWRSPSGVSNSSLGSLVGEELDEIHHVIELVLLGLNPYYPLCSEIDVVMTLPCLMPIT